MQKQTPQSKLTTLLQTYNTLEDIEYLEERLRTTPKFNKRLKRDRETLEELLELCNQRAIELQQQGCLPF